MNGLIGLAAAVVLIPGSSLGLITLAVQTLAGGLLCDDRDVLGPGVNGRKLNLFTGAVIAALVMLSIVLTASVLYPEITGEQIPHVLGGGSVLAVYGFGITGVLGRAAGPSVLLPMAVDAKRLKAETFKAGWRMPPLETLVPAQLTLSKRVWTLVQRGYLVVAVGMVLVRVIQLAIG